MDSVEMKFPEDLRRFVDSAPWRFAKTMPEWPHEYIVRQKTDRMMWERLAVHIRTHGFKGHFYDQTNLYFHEDGLRYWVIGAIINRCREEDSFDARMARGDLPYPPKK